MPAGNVDQGTSIYITDPEEFIDASNIGAGALVGTAQGAAQAQTAVGSNLQTFGFGGQAQGNILNIQQESPEALMLANAALAQGANVAGDALEAAQAAGAAQSALAMSALEKAAQREAEVSKNPLQQLLPFAIAAGAIFLGFNLLKKKGA